MATNPYFGICIVCPPEMHRDPPVKKHWISNLSKGNERIKVNAHVCIDHTFAEIKAGRE